MNIRIRLGLIVLSALLAVLAFPPFGYWPCVVLAWIPLFFAIKALEARAAFYVGWGQGFLVYGVCLSWLWGLFGPPSVVL